jgi:hypothetical protein
VPDGPAMCENDSTASLLHYVIPTQNSAKMFSHSHLAHL